MRQKSSNMDTIVVVLARKLQYFNEFKVRYTEFMEFQGAIKDTIAYMDNSVFRTDDEIENNTVLYDSKIQLDGEKLKNEFQSTLRERYPKVYHKLVNNAF